jgi:NADPH:quinone reductase-like Zn-dependent oxidoreductase
MKAIVFEEYGSPNVMAVQEVEKPIAKDNEVLIKVHSTSINDWDWALVRGNPFIIRMIYGAFFKPKIKIAGTDVAGIIESVGKNTKMLKAGDEVYGDISESGFGSFATYVCAKENALSIKPANISFEEAAATPHAAILAVQGLIDEGKIQNGQKILINGAGGGVGTLGIQIAKLLDVEVTGVDSTEKLGLMKSLGFDHVIDFRSEDFTQNGQQYDLILDAKTNRSMFDYSKSLSPNGAYITVGGQMSCILQIAILGGLFSLFGRKRLKVLSLKPNKGMDYINQLFIKNQLTPVIDGPYAFEEIPVLLQKFGDGNHKGKIVVNI